MGWNEVCKPKDERGVGLRQSSLVNTANMMKVGWNLVNRKDDLWVRVARSKYGCWEDMIPKVKMKNDAFNL